MKVTLVLSGLAFALAGCASSGAYSAIHDRDAGQVLVSYEVEILQDPPLSPEHASAVATRRCQMLGYGYTERDVHVTQHCSATDGTGACSLWQVGRTYQCAGDTITQPELRAGAVAHFIQPRPGSGGVFQGKP